MTLRMRLGDRRQVLILVLRTAAALLFLTTLGGLLGWAVRDRAPIVALLMYAPLLPLGIVALVADLAARGRGLPWGRLILGGAGVVAIAAGLSTNLGSRLPAAPDAPGVQSVTVLQWNVRWGGGGRGEDGEPARWATVCDDIARQAPDIVFLSESPKRDAVTSLEQMLGPTWTSVRSVNAVDAPYLYRLVVLSRWPVTLEHESAIPTGRVMQAVVGAPGGDVRVLVVDGESAPWHDRTSRIRAIAEFCHAAALSGKPIDVIAGDFNAVGRSVGFDALSDAGFTSASARGGGWRATWPSICPLYDIDHVWASRAWTPAMVSRTTNAVTDHRATTVRLVR